MHSKFDLFSFFLVSEEEVIRLFYFLELVASNVSMQNGHEKKYEFSLQKCEEITE